MAWIESHSELRDHPKRKRLSRRLGLDPYATIGLLNCFWWWVLDYAPDGDLSEFEAVEIADGIDWPGEPDELMEALQETGFVDDGQRVHDWADYGEKLYRRRLANANRMRQRRAEEAANKPASKGRAQHTKTACNARVKHVLSTCEEVDHSERTDRQTRQTDSRGRAREEAIEAENWTGLWITSMEEATGRRPSPKQIEIFGHQLKSMTDISPPVMQDTISRMVERNKGPTLLPNIYGDVQTESEQEILRMQVGGGKRVR